MTLVAIQAERGALALDATGSITKASGLGHAVAVPSAYIDATGYEVWTATWLEVGSLRQHDTEAAYPLEAPFAAF